MEDKQKKAATTTDDKQKKAVTAKLYNLKSYIDGKIQEVNAGMIELEQLPKAITMMSVKIVDELYGIEQASAV